MAFEDTKAIASTAIAMVIIKIQKGNQPKPKTMHSPRNVTMSHIVTAFFPRARYIVGSNNVKITTSERSNCAVVSLIPKKVAKSAGTSSKLIVIYLHSFRY